MSPNMNVISRIEHFFCYCTEVTSNYLLEIVLGHNQN